MKATVIALFIRWLYANGYEVCKRNVYHQLAPVVPDQQRTASDVEVFIERITYECKTNPKLGRPRKERGCDTPKVKAA